MLNIDNLKAINEELGYDGANVRINLLGQIISKFCQRQPFKFKGFRNQENGKGDEFGIIIHCSRKLEFAERQMKLLMKQIKMQFETMTVSIGIAKLLIDDTFKDWKKRALENVAKVKENGGNDIYSDINVDLNNSNNKKIENDNNVTKTSNNKKDNWIELGDLKEFETRLKKIVIDEDCNWIMALLDGDNMGDYKDTHGVDATQKEIDKIGNEIIRLVLIFGKDIINGYKLSGGDEFGLIIKNNNNTLPGKDIIRVLIENVESNCCVTISVGFSYLDVENEEMVDEWHERTNKYLTQAKKNGKNQMYFGLDLKKIEINRADSLAAVVDDNKEDDFILKQSLQLLQKKVEYSVKYPCTKNSMFALWSVF